ncbi:MAG: DUF4190 domain-containing protein [Verrucomicrobia bacterium]|nr:DUF4190 domain-containing protein [Verrucomicrobiota bacterium]
MYKIIGADGKEYGPITADQLRQWIAEGRANPRTKVLLEGTTEWKPLAEFPEFAATLTVTSSSPAPPAFQVMHLAPKTNSMAVAGLVMGICSIVLGCCCYGLPFNILGIIFSSIALGQIKKQPEIQQGKGLALAGLILSILSIVLIVVLLVVGVTLNMPEIMRELNKH